MYINSTADRDMQRLAKIATSIPVVRDTKRTPEEARAELQAKGVSITQWAVANKFSPNLVFEVLGGRKKCIRDQAHEIAIKLGLKPGEICADPARALEPASARQRAAA